MAADAPITCGNCDAEISPAFWRGDDFLRCSRCGQPVSVMVFPALLSGPATGQTGKQRLDQEEASCFFHPDRQAERACDYCGRFVCALCDLDFGQKHICPSCLDAAGENREIAVDIEHRRVCYEEVAFLLAALPLILGFLMWWLWIISGPAAIFVALWSWKRSSKFGSTGTLKRLAAIMLGGAEVFAWILIFRNAWVTFFPYID